MSDDETTAHRERMQAVKERQDAEVRSKTIKRGIVVVNTGDGKGKSTAAFGMAMRAAGHGQRVGVVQFIKGNWRTGELEALRRFPEIDHVISGCGFTWDTQDRVADVAAAMGGWKRALEMIEASRGEGGYALLILDELNIALSFDYVPLAEVLQALRDKPELLSIVITGRGAPAELIAVADTVTEMRPVKHAYAAGIKARKGVDF